MRVTRSMADDAALAMACSKYDQKISDAEKEELKLGDELVGVLIPKDVMECFEKNRSYFKSSSSISAVYENSEGYNHYTNIECSIGLPGNLYYDIDKKICDRAEAIQTKKRKLEKEKEKVRCRISDTLFALRTVARVDKEFHAAIKFLTIEEKQLPALKIDDLIKMFGK